jgi:glycosyltransferase involved in cell wall biosynthesis
MPLITIVTVVYNNKDFLERTILNVHNQQFEFFEYIVVDGNSTDGTIDIIKKHETKISIWKSEKDTGIYNAMNKAIGLSSGEWIFFLNAGDVFVDEYVLEKVSAHLTNSEYDIVYGDILKHDKSGNLFVKKSTAPGDKHKMYFCHQSVFCRTEICREMPFDEKYSMSADLKFFKLAFQKGFRFKQIDLPITIFDTTGVSNRNRTKGLRENIKVIKEINTFSSRIKLLPRLYFTLFFAVISKLKKTFTRVAFDEVENAML